MLVIFFYFNIITNVNHKNKASSTGLGSLQYLETVLQANNVSTIKEEMFFTFVKFLQNLSEKSLWDLFLEIMFFK